MTDAMGIGARVVRDLSGHSVAQRELAAASDSISNLLPQVEKFMGEARGPMKEMIAGMRRRKPVNWLGDSSAYKRMGRDWVRPAQVARPATRAHEAYVSVEALAETLRSVGVHAQDVQLSTSTAALLRAATTLRDGTHYVAAMARAAEAAAPRKIHFDQSARPFAMNFSASVGGVARRRMDELERAVALVRRDLDAAPDLHQQREGARKAVEEMREQAEANWKEQREVLQLTQGT